MKYWAMDRISIREIAVTLNTICVLAGINLCSHTQLRVHVYIQTIEFATCSELLCFLGVRYYNFRAIMKYVFEKERILFNVINRRVVSRRTYHISFNVSLVPLSHHKMSNVAFWI